VALLYSQWQQLKLRQDVKRLREAVATANEEQRQFLERIEEERQRTATDRQLLEKEIAEARKREEELNGKLREAQSAEARAVRDDLKLTRERLVTLESERAAGERIIRDYGGGVALIQGSYGWSDAEGRALRVSAGDDGDLNYKKGDWFTSYIKGTHELLMKDKDDQHSTEVTPDGKYTFKGVRPGKYRLMGVNPFDMINLDNEVSYIVQDGFRRLLGLTMAIAFSWYQRGKGKR
jgi:hypothetical protein